MPIKYDIIAILFAKFFPIQTYYYPSLDTLVLNQVIGNGVKKEIMWIIAINRKMLWKLRNDGSIVNIARC